MAEDKDLNKTTEEKEVVINPGIVPTNLQDEMKASYIDYAMSVIVGRALPDVRDGLKPVHIRPIVFNCPFERIIGIHPYVSAC